MEGPMLRLILSLAATVALAAVITPAWAEAAWDGSEVTKDGVTHVMNPATPIEPASTASPGELWRVGGEDDEDVIFGVVSNISADEEGNLYLLDAQLNEVMVFTDAGEYLRSIGRAGEGPGEFRRPIGMFFTPDGNVAVLQSMPGRIILMTPEGEAIGNHPVPEAPDGGMMMFFQGDRAGDHIILDTNSFVRRDTGMDITRELVRVNAQGETVGTLHKAKMDVMSFDEKEMIAILWTCGPDGRVYVSDNFDGYSVKVYGPSGTVDHVIERAYEHRKRTAEEMEESKPRVMLQRGNRRESPETKGSETDRDIMALLPRHDGTLWVVSSHGGRDQVDGVIATFDVFGEDGRFEQQVTVEGDGDFVDDGIHFVGDKLYVVKGLRSARRAQHGGREGEEMSEEELESAEPVALVCYDLGGIVQGSR
jgi:hypothetical protein